MMMLKVYTQNNCPYCVTMINNLAEWGLAFDVINISNDPDEKAFLKEQGVKTVPQLFLHDFNVNEGIDTDDFTEEMFYNRLDVFIQEHTFTEIEEMIGQYDESKRVS